jgi:hypothetical protein
MKALSVRQPWAWLLVHGPKDIENRNWYTNYRGWVMIHASKTFDRSAYEELKKMVGLNLPAINEFPLGAIVWEV